MGVFLEMLERRAEPLVWLDDTAYCGRLLAGGQIPWLDATSLIGWRVKAIQLLRSSVAVLDVGALASAYLEARSGSGDAATPKHGPLAPLADLLESDFRNHVRDVLHGLRRSVEAPLALVIPSPRAWPVLTNPSHFAEAGSIGEDDTDRASMLTAAFLRNFGDCRVDILLLVDDPVQAALRDEEIDWYQSVISVGHYYRWDVGLWSPFPAADASGSGATAGGFDFVIAPAAGLGVIVEESFWHSDAAAPRLPAGGFRYGRIPADAVPERTLSRLAELRRE
jgi:hypothetical protein